MDICVVERGNRICAIPIKVLIIDDKVLDISKLKDFSIQHDFSVVNFIHARIVNTVRSYLDYFILFRQYF